MKKMVALIIGLVIVANPVLTSSKNIPNDLVNRIETISQITEDNERLEAYDCLAAELAFTVNDIDNLLVFRDIHLLMSEKEVGRIVLTDKAFTECDFHIKTDIAGRDFDVEFTYHDGQLHQIRFTGPHYGKHQVGYALRDVSMLRQLMVDRYGPPSKISYSGYPAWGTICWRYIWLASDNNDIQVKVGYLRCFSSGFEKHTAMLLITYGPSLQEIEDAK